MRWLALLLAALNLGILFAGGQSESPRSSEASAGTLPRVTSLRLEGGTPKTHGDEYRCVRLTLGFFETRAEAEAFAERLDDRPDIVEQERALTPLHWVLIPPQPPEEARRQFRELYLQGVDAYIVSQGEYQNAISLGLFESFEAAQSVLDEKKRANLNVVLAKFPRNRLGYALVFQIESMSKTEWVQAVEADTGHEFEFVESNSCESVARSEKNP